MTETSDSDAGGGTKAAKPQVDLDLTLCKACGICIELCPEKVFDRDKVGNPVVARPEECTSCLLCELHCPDFAIEVRRRARKRGAKPAAVEPEQLATVGEACDHEGAEG